MKTTKLFISLFLSCFLLINNSVFSQDSIATKKHNLLFSLNLIQLYINEASIYVDYPIGKRQTIGFNGGYIYKNSIVKDFHQSLTDIFSSDNQIKHPTTAYSGLVTRVYYKIYYKGKRRAYIGAQLDYKYLTYQSQDFQSDSKGISYSTTRSENAYQYGVDIIYGFHFLDYESKFNLELFVSAGYRHRHRNILTESNLIEGTVYNPYNYDNFYPQGISHQSQDFVMVTIGLKLGFNIFYK